jgi:hypothetical protein
MKKLANAAITLPVDPGPVMLRLLSASGKMYVSGSREVAGRLPV